MKTFNNRISQNKNNKNKNKARINKRKSLFNLLLQLDQLKKTIIYLQRLIKQSKILKNNTIKIIVLKK